MRLCCALLGCRLHSSPYLSIHSLHHVTIVPWQVWDDLDVAEAPLPNSAARLLHLMALLHSWNLLKFVDPATGKTIRPAPLAAPHSGGGQQGALQGPPEDEVCTAATCALCSSKTDCINWTNHPRFAQVAAQGKVRVRGRWLFRCFGCYVPEEELLLVEAERLNSKISKKERAEETSKQRLLLGTSARPH